MKCCTHNKACAGLAADSLRQIQVSKGRPSIGEACSQLRGRPCRFAKRARGARGGSTPNGGKVQQCRCCRIPGSLEFEVDCFSALVYSSTVVVGAANALQLHRSKTQGDSTHLAPSLDQREAQMSSLSTERDDECASSPAPQSSAITRETLFSELLPVPQPFRVKSPTCTFDNVNDRYFPWAVVLNHSNPYCELCTPGVVRQALVAPRLPSFQ